MLSKLGAFVVIVGLTAGSALGAAYTCDIPQELAAHAKISQWEAVAAAEKSVTGAKVDKVELGVEKGTLAYTVDLITPDEAGVARVVVDAMTGKVLSASVQSPSSPTPTR
jgi:uncharacterized membrane protein YkoI